MNLEQGDIVWLVPPDVSRGSGKKRPAVILTATEEIVLDTSIVLAALTTTYQVPPPNDHVELPWSHQGHPMTRLRRRSAAVCNWLIEASPSELVPSGGRVPTRFLLEILKRLPT